MTLQCHLTQSDLSDLPVQVAPENILESFILHDPLAPASLAFWVAAVDESGHWSHLFGGADIDPTLRAAIIHNALPAIRHAHVVFMRPTAWSCSPGVGAAIYASLRPIVSINAGSVCARAFTTCLAAFTRSCRTFAVG